METTILQFFESLRCGFLNFLMTAFTFMGEETFIVLAVCVVYWAVNKRAGEFLLTSLLLSTTANGVIKDSVKRIRPYQKGIVQRVDIDNFFVDTVSLDGSYSFPSGHSQIAGTFFTGAACSLKKKRYYIVGAVAVFAVMLSRVYLGVHYPTDVLAGAALGIGMSLLWLLVFNRFFEKRHIIFLIVTALFAVSLFFMKSEDTFKAVGACAGAAIGLFLENRYIRFIIHDKIGKKILRVAVGAAVVLLMRFALKAIFPERLFFAFLRYLIILLSATFLYPLLFKKLNF